MPTKDNSLLYISRHIQGQSVSWIECKKIKNKVNISKIFFAKGNVVSLCSVRRILEEARLQLA
jgi:hypothetical protein